MARARAMSLRAASKAFGTSPDAAAWSSSLGAAEVRTRRELRDVRRGRLEFHSMGSGGLPSYHGTVNDIATAFILDSGATTSFIGRGQVAKLGLATRKGPRIKVQHSSGQPEHTHSKVEFTLRVMEDVRLRVEAYVLDSLTGFDVVLGDDWMRRHSVDQAFRPESTEVRLTLGQRRLSLFPSRADPRSSKTRPRGRSPS